MLPEVGDPSDRPGMSEIETNPTTVLEALLPAAVAWAEEECVRGLAAGMPLSPDFLRIARRAGVQAPDRIRLTVSRELPEPGDAALRQAAGRYGFFGPGMVGLTLGDAIFVLDGHVAPRILSHECRHVQQYEAHGGIRSFLPIYLPDVLAAGYRESRFERDARSHETDER